LSKPTQATVGSNNNKKKLTEVWVCTVKEITRIKAWDSNVLENLTVGNCYNFNNLKRGQLEYVTSDETIVDTVMIDGDKNIDVSSTFTPLINISGNDGKGMAIAGVVVKITMHEGVSTTGKDVGICFFTT